MTQQNKPSAMELAVSEQIKAEISAYHNRNVRLLGGVPVNLKSGVFNHAMREAQVYAASGASAITDVQMQCALDIAGVIGAVDGTPKEQETIVGLVSMFVTGKLIAPISDSYWVANDREGFFVNARDARVVKNGDNVYFTEGKIFVDDEGGEELRGEESWVLITLPIEQSKLPVEYVQLSSTKAAASKEVIEDAIIAEATA